MRPHFSTEEWRHPSISINRSHNSIAKSIHLSSHIVPSHTNMYASCMHPRLAIKVNRGTLLGLAESERLNRTTATAKIKRRGECKQKKNEKGNSSHHHSHLSLSFFSFSLSLPLSPFSRPLDVSLAHIFIRLNSIWVHLHRRHNPEFAITNREKNAH